MKKISIIQFIIFLSIVIVSCAQTKKMNFDKYEQAGKSQPVQDSFLLQLQQNSTVVFATVIEKFAWGRSTSYRIIAKQNNEWKGYIYSITQTPANGNSHSEIKVNAATCDSLAQYFQEKEIWTIPGDTGNNFCDDASKQCNINDGVTWGLMVLTPNSSFNAFYYEPAFYEACCPGNEKRKLFLEASSKVNAATGGSFAGGGGVEM